MAEQNPAFHETISSVNALVRTIGSGVVAYAAYVNLTDAGTDLSWLFPGTFDEHGIWPNLLVSAISGVVGYAVYMSVFETLFMHVVLCVLRASKGQRLPLNGTITNRQLIRILLRERASRYESANGKVKAVQNQLEFFYSWLIFLYCTAILLICAAALALWKESDTGVVLPLPAFGILSWLLGLFSDVQLTRQELWLLQHHPEWEEHKGDAAIASDIASSARTASSGAKSSGTGKQGGSAPGGVV